MANGYGKAYKTPEYLDDPEEVKWYLAAHMRMFHPAPQYNTTVVVTENAAKGSDVWMEGIDKMR